MNLYRISRNQPSYTKNYSMTDHCIILDLDETLVHSCEDYQKLLELNLFQDPEVLDLRRRLYNLFLSGYNHPPSMWGITRPYMEDFIFFCFNYFQKVCVWSAGTYEYVHNIIEQTFPPGYKPDIIYTRDNCYYSQNGELFKPIEVMAKKENLQEILRLDNTLFVDDRALAFIKNPDNGILIPAYEPKNYQEYINEDLTLLYLMNWLVSPEVVRAKDVRTLDKSRIFRV